MAGVPHPLHGPKVGLAGERTLGGTLAASVAAPHNKLPDEKSEAPGRFLPHRGRLFAG